MERKGFVQYIITWYCPSLQIDFETYVSERIDNKARTATYAIVHSIKGIWKLNFRQYRQMEKHTREEAQAWRKSEGRR